MEGPDNFRWWTPPNNLFIYVNSFILTMGANVNAATMIGMRSIGLMIKQRIRRVSVNMKFT